MLGPLHEVIGKKDVVITNAVSYTYTYTTTKKSQKWLEIKRQKKKSTSIMLSDDFIEYLSASLEIKKSKVVKAVDSWSPTASPKSAGTEKKPSAGTAERPSANANAKGKPETNGSVGKSKKSSSVDKPKTCQRIPKGKTELCGKTAKNSFVVDGETKWYCGICFKVVSKASAGSAAGSATTKKATKKAKMTESEIKSKSLVNTVLMQKDVAFDKEVIDGKVIHVHRKSGLVVDRDTRLVTGMLKGKKIVPCDDKTTRFAEASGFRFKSESDSESDEASVEIDEKEVLESDETEEIKSDED